MTTKQAAAGGATAVGTRRSIRLSIGGEWQDAVSGATFEAINPATGAVIADVAEGAPEDADRAIEAARAATSTLRAMTAWDRSRMLRRVADVMEGRADELARVISEDQGKPLEAEARGEVGFAIEGFREASEHVKWLETAVIPVEDPNKRVFSFRQPRGVYAVITPWNFPLNIPIEYIAPGLAGGNAIVWVPAPTTPVVAGALMECLLEADVPAGAVNLVTGFGPVVGDRIVSSPGTDAIGFTGSTATGHTIAQRAAGKPLLLELGGNGPVIVLDDADMDLAITRAAFSAFWNAGQVCSAAERIIVQEPAHDRVLEGLVGAANAVKLGDPTDAATTMGPLNNHGVATKMDRHLEDSVGKGSTILVGGGRADGHPTDLYYQPTVVDGVSPDSALFDEESFGPVAPIMTVPDDDAAIALADQGSLGLVSAVFTTDLKRAYRYIEALRTGIVVVNDTTNYWELHIPFGGASGKRSGIGRVGGKYALQEMTDLRTAAIDLT